MCGCILRASLQCLYNVPNLVVECLVAHKLFLSMRSFSIVDPYGLFFSISETFGNQSHAVSKNLMYLFHINSSSQYHSLGLFEPLVVREYIEGIETICP